MGLLLDLVPCFILHGASHWLCCVGIWIMIGYGVVGVASEMIVTYRNAYGITKFNCTRNYLLVDIEIVIGTSF